MSKTLSSLVQSKYVVAAGAGIIGFLLYKQFQNSQRSGNNTSKGLPLKRRAAKGLGLSDEEEDAINSTWSLISKDLKGVGVRFFLFFFERQPQYQKLFRGFANVRREDLAENASFKAHAFTVMSAIDGFVRSMDDIEVLKSLLLTTGINHARRKLTSADFDVILAVLLAFFQKELGAKGTAVVLSAWTKVLTTVISIVKQGLESALKSNN